MKRSVRAIFKVRSGLPLLIWFFEDALDSGNEATQSGLSELKINFLDKDLRSGTQMFVHPVRVSTFWLEYIHALCGEFSTLAEIDETDSGDAR